MNPSRTTQGLKDFVGKTAFVTGAGNGIGRAAAKLFAARGAAVAVVDLNPETGMQTVSQIQAEGGTAIFIRADVSSEEAVEAAVQQTVATFGGLHCAFNNAGFTGQYVGFHTLSLEDWNRLIAVNLTSVFLCMKHQIAHMLKAGGGSIVNTSSGAGVVGAPGMPHYTAAKHGVLGLVKVAAKEFAGQNIRVNAICPGVTDTPMLRTFAGEGTELERALVSSLPGGRMGLPEEIAEAAVWLSSDGASFVSGESMLVDAASVCR